MKSLITAEDKKQIEDYFPIFSTILSSKDSESHFENLRTRHVHPDHFKFLKNEACIKNGTGFCLAISLHDGTVLFVSNTVNRFLGYTKEMLLGQCFLNYLYPQDRLTLTNQLTHGLQAQFNETGSHPPPPESTFFCRIRQYHNLKYGFGITDKKTRYKTFQFVTQVKSISQDDETGTEDITQTVCLVVSITPVLPAYKVSEEIPTMSSFSTRHTADCHFSHIDSSSIPYLGFLPQDLLGHSVFDFYHMDDMPQLKDIYELVMKEQGNSFRSKPYRFKVSNGNYIFLETEWSCFINPWSKKLEFVVGQHRVLKGPTKINVFDENSKEETTFSDEILRESLRIQEEIKNLLSQPVKSLGRDGSQHRCQKRKVGIASFVSSLVDEMCQGGVGNVAVEQGAKAECSCSDHGSVVMGEISPHQEYNGSDPSSMTPETSQEIRYQDNIERFFASQPKTYSSSDGSGESKSENRQQAGSVTSSYDETGKNSLVDSGNGSLRTKSESFQPMDMSQASSSRGSGGGSSENFISRNSLTEENLTQHNRLTQKYKQQQQRKAKQGGGTNQQPRKEMRLKRGGSPQQLDSNKHNKSSKTRVKNSVPTQTDLDCPPTNAASAGGCNVSPGDGNRGQHSGSVPLQTTGHIPMGPFSLNPSFSSFAPTAMPQASNMPWNNMMSSTYSTSPYNPSVPTYTMPQQYCYIPGGSPASGTPPTPFFMPVMYFGAVPMYPPMSPVVQHSSAGMWSTQMPSQQQGIPHGETTQDNGSQGNRNQHMSNLPTYSTPTINTEKKVSANQPWLTKNASDLDMGQPPIGPPKTKDVITSFSGTFCKQSSPPCMVQKRHKTVNDEKVSPISRMDEDSGYPHHAQQPPIHECERDSVSMTSSSSILKSDDLSSHSPSYRTEHDLEVEVQQDKRPHRVPKDPPWMEGLEMTSEIIFRYQLTSKSLEEVLKKDLEALKILTQPDMVNKQLAMLQSELAAEPPSISGDEDDTPLLDEKSVVLVPCSSGHLQQLPGNCFSKPDSTFKHLNKGIDLGFATVEEDVGEELQAKEDAILHFMCDNM